MFLFLLNKKNRGVNMKSKIIVMILLLNNLGIILWSIFLDSKNLAFLYNIPDLAINTVSGIVPNPDLLDIKQSLVDKKIYEINELYKEELFNNVITDADLSYIVKSFTVADLNSSDINNIIFTIMSCYNG